MRCLVVELFLSDLPSVALGLLAVDKVKALGLEL